MRHVLQVLVDLTVSFNEIQLVLKIAIFLPSALDTETRMAEQLIYT
jgi:hypothetical protein